ncbi:MAG TPA: VWA domain-containing protein [Polyangia bacterium]
MTPPFVPSRRRLLAAALATAIIPTSGCYLFQSSTTFYGLKTAGQKVVFVVDISGSMEGKNEGSIQDQLTGVAVRKSGTALGNALGGTLGSIVGKQTSSEITKLGGAKRELIPALQGLPESSSFSIITFGQQTKPWLMGMVSATGTNRNIAAAFVKDLEANGGTPAKRALEQAFEYPDVNLIFFVSDGQPTDGRAADILNHVRMLNSRRGVVVSTVGLGGDQDEAFLAALANQNGGRYVKK